MERVCTEIHIRICEASDIVVARRHTRELAVRQGLSEVAVAALAIAVTEVATNIVVHAGAGEIVLAAATGAGRCGVTVTALDAGPGILEIEQAMRDGFSTGTGLGFGLPGARRLVDEFEIESIVGVGTRVMLRKWTATDAP